MTKGSQQALRRIMELHSSTTRFALACNTSSKIIEPIQSRCAVVRFRKLSDEQVAQRLAEVMEAEKVAHTTDGLEALIYTAEGDMRTALNNLQSTWAGFGFVNAENVFKVCDQPHPVIIAELLEFCESGEFMKAQEKLDYLLGKGYAPVDIIGTIAKVTRSRQMDEFKQLQFLKEIGVIHMRIVDGVESRLQLSSLIAKLCRLKVNS